MQEKRRGRFTVPIADLSALRAPSNIQVKNSGYSQWMRRASQSEPEFPGNGKDSATQEEEDTYTI